MSTIGDLLSGLWDLVKSGFQGICDAFIAFGDWIIDSCIQLAVDFGLWVKDDVFGVVFAVIRENPFGNFMVMQSEYLSWANYFFPITELFGLLQLLLSIWIAILLLKIALKLIPTVY